MRPLIEFNGFEALNEFHGPLGYEIYDSGVYRILDIGERRQITESPIWVYEYRFYPSPRVSDVAIAYKDPTDGMLKGHKMPFTATQSFYGILGELVHKLHLKLVPGEDTMEQLLTFLESSLLVSAKFVTDGTPDKEDA